MTKQTSAAVFLSLLSVIGTTVTARADIIQSIPSYDSPLGYDYVDTLPPDGSTTIGTFAFSIPEGAPIYSLTISGTFGNGDSPTTALSDYYLGFAGDETAVEVAACDNGTDDCSSNYNGPTVWTLTLTQAQIADLSTGLAAGSLDFTYTWDSTPAFALEGLDQYVYTGAASIDIQDTPEPATLLIGLSGLAGLIALRRFRKA